jgi:2-dehydropantoate 2-reductase
MWYLTDSIGPYRTSTVLDFIARKPIEVYYLFSKPLERARELNVPAPKLESVVAQIEGLQAFHKLY